MSRVPTNSVEQTPSHLLRDFREELFTAGTFRADVIDPIDPLVMGTSPLLSSNAPSNRASPAALQHNADEATEMILPSVKSSNSLVEAMFEGGAFRRSRSSTSSDIQSASPAIDGDLIMLRGLFDVGFFRKGSDNSFQRPSGHDGVESTSLSHQAISTPSYKELLLSAFDSGTYRDCAPSQVHTQRVADDSRKRLIRSGRLLARPTRSPHMSASAPVSPRSASPLSVPLVDCTERQRPELAHMISRTRLLSSMFDDGAFRGRGNAIPLASIKVSIPSTDGETSSSMSRELFAEGVFRQHNKTLMEKYVVDHGGQAVGKGPKIRDEVPTFDCLLNDAFVRGALTRSAHPSSHDSSNPTSADWNNAHGVWNVAPADIPRTLSGRIAAISAPISPGEYNGLKSDQFVDFSSAQFMESMFNDGQFRQLSKNNSFVDNFDESRSAGDDIFHKPLKNGSFVNDADIGRFHLSSIAENGTKSASDISGDGISANYGESLASVAFSSGLFRPRADDSNAKRLGRL